MAGQGIVERDHTLLTGCRSPLDQALAESVGSLALPRCTHPELSSPEQIAAVGAVIFVGRKTSTFITEVTRVVRKLNQKRATSSTGTAATEHLGLNLKRKRLLVRRGPAQPHRTKT